MAYSVTVRVCDLLACSRPTVAYCYSSNVANKTDTYCVKSARYYTLLKPLTEWDNVRFCG